MTLVLLGYMGSGKSSVGVKLSKLLNYDFIDFDTYIEDKLKMTISDIFDKRGEVFFRKQEHLFLEEVVAQDHTVVALGGGTPCYGNNLNVIKSESHTKSIYLKLSVSSLSNRLFEEKSNRPLISHLNTKAELIEFIGKHIFERAPVYEQADIILNTDGLSVDEVVESLLLQLF